MIFNCPGSQKFKQPQPESINCPACGAEAEIWTDEFQATCPNCKKKVARLSAQSCLGWCKSARECVGDEVYDEYLKSVGLQKKRGR